MAALGVDQVEPHGGEEEGADAIEEEDDGRAAAEDGVEPEGEVHLLVDDVLREDAEAVVPLLAA